MQGCVHELGFARANTLRPPYLLANMLCSSCESTTCHEPCAEVRRTGASDMAEQRMQAGESVRMKAGERA
eukprot:6178822-Pleurochrysis_carterae.AAC.2